MAASPHARRYNGFMGYRPGIGLLLLGLALAGLTALAVAASSPASGCAGPCLPGDIDGDGIKDWADNCPREGNPRQKDLDQDSGTPIVDLGTPPKPAGDLTGPVHVYPYTPVQNNLATAELPTDRDRMTGGDECDLDDDNDGWLDRKKAGFKGPDNCKSIANPDQADDDRDGVGNACDDEFDGAVGAPPVDLTPLKVKVRRLPRLRYSELGLGLPVEVTCTRACQLTAELRLDRRSARGLRMPKGVASTTIARGKAQLLGKGTTYVIVPIPARTVRNLGRRLKSVRPLLTVAAGGRKQASQRLTIRR